MVAGCGACLLSSSTYIIEDRIVDARVRDRAHRALENDDILRRPRADDGHTGNRRVGIVLSIGVDGIGGANHKDCKGRQEGSGQW